MNHFFKVLLVCCLALSFSVAQAAAPKKWTFLVFINGNNSLDWFGSENIKSMEKVGSNDEVNIVVQWASASTHKCVRMLVKKSKDPKQVTSPVIEDLGYVDMGNYQNLEKFIQWGVNHYPAEHYFVDVWNHGNGWHLKKAAMNNSGVVRDISYDDISGNHITTEELGQVMEHAATIIGHKVDIYGSDACLMAMAEVANEMSDSVDYFVGSQEVEPGWGWPYSELLSQWEAVSNATPEQVAKISVDTYVKAYQGGVYGDSEVTFSALNLNKFPRLNKAIADLGSNLRQLTPEDRAKCYAATKEVLTFRSADYADLLDYLKHLSASQISDLNLGYIAEVQEAAKDVIIANADTKEYANATGLSVWIPLSRWSYDSKVKRYQALHFNQNSQWGDTLNALVPVSDEG